MMVIANDFSGLHFLGYLVRAWFHGTVAGGSTTLPLLSLIVIPVFVQNDCNHNEIVEDDATPQIEPESLPNYALVRSPPVSKMLQMPLTLKKVHS